MWTSCFSKVKTLPADVEPVGISRGIPAWYKGRRELRLAPSREMLKMSDADYDRHFAPMLAALDPREVYDALGPNAVLLCWERPGQACHRRTVAAWFQEYLGVVVPEWVSASRGPVERDLSADDGTPQIVAKRFGAP
jgi:hypothetical protein